MLPHLLPPLVLIGSVRKAPRMPARPARAAVPHPLDEVPQTFRAGDSYEVRDGLVTCIRRDLPGPWDGETETLPNASSGPRDRYLVGMLGP